MAHDNNVQPVAPLTISSPRMMSPRSQRSHRSRRSPRQRYAEHNEHELELAQSARAAENLTAPENPSAMNVDPDEPYLAPAGNEAIRDIEAQQAREEAERSGRDSNGNSRFVGGFAFDRLKRAVQGASIQWGSGSRQARGVGDIYNPPYTVSPGQSAPGPSHHQRYESSSDDTAHYPATTEEGTTAIDHTMPQPQYISAPPIDMSPQLVEPLPADDYRKMKSPSPPPPSTTFSTYASRLKKIFKEIDSLPWVSSDRITVDYYPGQFKRRERIPQGVGHKSRSAISMSWYGENYRPPGMVFDSQQLDLTAGESPEVKAAHGKEFQSPSDEQSPTYYTSESGQVWPAVSTVYTGVDGERMPGEVPVSSPDPNYRPFRAPPTPMPEPHIPYPPLATPPTVADQSHYTNDAGQSWPVIAPSYPAQIHAAPGGDYHPDTYGAYVPVAGPSR
ncbi:hypothetical protein AAF712_013659 [Marasmius tenuissimus]|uniref:Uncharacterized protein n=1 Tax=Marasmius tenuissimus TaxID=585030 RepID=A0ABR2ZE73_9AGAR